MKTAILLLTLALGLLAAGCAKEPTEAGKSATPNNTAVESEQADGSNVITVDAPNGIKSEVRHFKTGDISQVSRTSRPDGRRNVSVTFRDGRTTQLQDPADMDRAMEASLEEITAAALKTMPASSNQPVVGANKSEPTNAPKKDKQ